MFSKSSSNTQKIEQKLTLPLLTVENITIFFQFIAESVLKSELSAAVIHQLQMLIKNYQIYLKQAFIKNPGNNPGFLKSLVFTLTILRKEEFFKKFDVTILEMIIKDISSNGKSLPRLNTETVNELLEKLEEIQNQANYNANLSRVTKEKQLLEKIRLNSHLAIEESLMVADGKDYTREALGMSKANHIALIAESQYNEGKKLHTQENFQEALEKYLLAQKTLNTIPVNLQIYYRKHSIAYKISIARITYALAVQLRKKGKYKEAFEKYFEAKKLLEAPPINKLNPEDITKCEKSIINLKKHIAAYLIQQTHVLQAKQDFNNVLINYILAYKIFTSIPTDDLTDMEKSMLINYKINITRGIYILGIQLVDKGQHEEALKKFTLANTLYEDIPKDQLNDTEVDNCSNAIKTLQTTLQSKDNLQPIMVHTRKMK